MPEEPEIAPAQQPEPQWPDPVFTVALIAANVAIFFLMVAKGVSFWTTNEQQALQWGANLGPLTLSGQYWRLFTSNFIHIGFVHLAFNMIVLFGLGRLAEYFYDSTDFVLLYGYTGLFSALLGVIWEPNATSAGASGAIFGISGVMLTTLLYGDLPITKESREYVLSGVIQFTVLNLFIGGVQNYLPGIFHARIDNAGHIGGLLSGLLVGMIFGKHLSDSPQNRRYRVWAWAVLFAVFLLALAATVHFSAIAVPLQPSFHVSH